MRTSLASGTLSPGFPNVEAHESELKIQEGATIVVELNEENKHYAKTPQQAGGAAVKDADILHY